MKRIIRPSDGRMKVIGDDGQIPEGWAELGLCSTCKENSVVIGMHVFNVPIINPATHRVFKHVHVNAQCFYCRSCGLTVATEAGKEAFQKAKEEHAIKATLLCSLNVAVEMIPRSVTLKDLDGYICKMFPGFTDHDFYLERNTSGMFVVTAHKRKQEQKEQNEHDSENG